MLGWILAAILFGIVGYFIWKKDELCDAYVYKHLETGELLYCDEEQATHTDYQFVGQAKVKCEKVNRCSLS